MARHHRVFLGAAVVVAVAVVAGCAPSGGGSEEKTELRIAGNQLSTWDPFDGAQIFRSPGQAVYDPLIMVTSEGVDPLPWLAESFVISEDGYTISFKLREDVDFIDGTHFDAPGLEKYLDALFASDGYAWKPRVADQFGAEATATGEYTLDIVTSKQPISYQGLWQLSLTPIASPATVGVEGAFDDGPVGSGPYTVMEQTADVSVSFERNPDYWNEEAYPYDFVTITVYADEVAALNAMITGQLDASLVSIGLAQEAESKGLTVTEGPGNVGAIFVDDHNGSVHPAFGDVRVRQAMSMVFDREQILDVLNLGFGRVSSQAFSPGSPSYVDGGDDRYPYDIEGAKALMAEAGYADGFDVTIGITGGPGFGFLNTANIEPIIQTSLAEIGINVTYEPLSADPAEYLGQIATGEYPLIILNMPQTNWIVAFDEWWIGINDPELEALVKESRESGPADQLVAYKKIGEFMLDEAWYIPFSFPAATIVSVPEVAVQIDGAYTNPKLWQYTPAD